MLQTHSLLIFNLSSRTDLQQAPLLPLQLHRMSPTVPTVNQPLSPQGASIVSQVSRSRHSMQYFAVISPIITGNIYSRTFSWHDFTLPIIFELFSMRCHPTEMFGMKFLIYKCNSIFSLNRMWLPTFFPRIWSLHKVWTATMPHVKWLIHRKNATALVRNENTDENFEKQSHCKLSM